MTAVSLIARSGEVDPPGLDLVDAVRSYSQLDRASVQVVDVTDGIESTLVMLGHKLGGGVTVERDYAADLPRIEAIPGELNQVWTNLIDNAIDAMDGHGTLRISTRRRAATTSSSRSPTAAPACRPTCRPGRSSRSSRPRTWGSGTGLGLDISRRIIVERHHGEIAIESEPGRTVMSVRLPRSPA